MPGEITQIATVQSTVAATYDDIVALRTKIDIAIYNITIGNGTFGGAEYEEHGEVGFKIRTDQLLANLLKWREALTKDLLTPELLGEVYYQISQAEDGVCSELFKMQSPTLFNTDCENS